MIEDKQTENIPSQYLIYSTTALTEYKSYLNYYYQWETSGENPPKNIVPFSLLPRSMLFVDPVNRSENLILLPGNGNVAKLSDLQNLPLRKGNTYMM